MTTDQTPVKNPVDAAMHPNLPVVAPGRELVPLASSVGRPPGIDIALGLVALAVDALRAGPSRAALEPSVVVDASLGATRRAWTLGSLVVTRVVDVATPVAGVVADPPLVPRALRPVTLVNGSAAAWRARRPASVAAARELRDDLIRSVVAATAQRLDLTEIVVDNVELTKVVTAALDGMDLTELAHQRLDLLELADYIVEGIDLPEIIRQSTGSVASESLRALRLQSVDADEAVQRIVDRILLWRRRHSGRNVDAAAPDRHQ